MNQSNDMNHGKSNHESDSDQLNGSSGQHAGWSAFIAEHIEEGAARNPDWLGNARVYEWSDEYGNVAPRHPGLEEELFGDMKPEGEHRGVLDIEVRVEGPERLQPIRKVGTIPQSRCERHFL
jgi:ATP-dependent RNA helicase DDX3X